MLAKGFSKLSDASSTSSVAGLVHRRRWCGAHRQWRVRRLLPGMLLHLDGSSHAWFADHRRYDLLVVLDDATSESYYAQLVEQESTRTVLEALRELVRRHELFCALYGDRAIHHSNARAPYHESSVAGARPFKDRLSTGFWCSGRECSQKG
jgi:hypothetical protein